MTNTLLSFNFNGKFTEWLRCVAADHNTGVQIPHLPFLNTIFLRLFLWTSIQH